MFPHMAPAIVEPLSDIHSVELCACHLNRICYQPTGMVYFRHSLRAIFVPCIALIDVDDNDDYHMQIYLERKKKRNFIFKLV